MIWSRWFPWKAMIRRIARSHGFLDPIAVLSRLERFAQPSEVAEPIELLRAGVVLHARGLINSRVIQHNLDWVWPYWVERQFDPRDRAFVPRAFSITNINLTHRNWTAVGVPDGSGLPIVDPRGLVTPLYDGWSLDGWILSHDGRALLPSRLQQADQKMIFDDGLAIETRTGLGGLNLHSRCVAESGTDGVKCVIDYKACSDEAGWFVLALRPYNPEGVSFIHGIQLDEDRRGWKIEEKHCVRFSETVDSHHASDYASGDVHIHLRDREDTDSVHCHVGMATAAAVFKLESGVSRTIRVEVPLPRDEEIATGEPRPWEEALESCSRLRTADSRIQYLYEAALRSLVLHSPKDVYPGPYTYRRFWFRDAAFIVHALLVAGMTSRARRALDQFPPRQNASGFFHSQDGEWDSNGEALWIFQRYCELTGEDVPLAWREPIVKGARWIIGKRLSEKGESPHAGLLPAGFSAEHLGPNDYYYWDDFWGVAGLESAARLLKSYDDDRLSEEFRLEAERFRKAIDRSLGQVEARLGRPAIPASPHRRMDAGAIGSIACGYPLNLFAPDDPRLRDTVNFLLTNCFVDGAFFQDMIHSGLNAYLTLEVAQVLLRDGNPRYLELLETVASLASPTGQWPEAIHPLTAGGCMGDGHHIWAAAEWVLMIRNCLVREGEDDGLIIGSGIAPSWLSTDQPLEFVEAPTPYGRLSLHFRLHESELEVSWRANWFSEPPPMHLRIPGWKPVCVPGSQDVVRLDREGSA